MTNKVIEAPWTQEQVDALNEFQNLGMVHPYTCDGPTCDKGPSVNYGILVATPNGWVCPCKQYTQGWAHGATADPNVAREILETFRSFKENFTARASTGAWPTVPSDDAGFSEQLHEPSALGSEVTGSDRT